MMHTNKTEAPDWDGEGPARIGNIVSCISEPEIEAFKIIHWHDKLAWLRDVDTGRHGLYPLNDLRPIRSEEDRLIEEAMSLIGVEPDEHGAESVVFRMIRAGYRKTGVES